MIGIPKSPRYRNAKILDFARHVEHCTFCATWSEPGSIVAAHSNESRHGKGSSLKAHDVFVAYLCPACHAAVDADREDQDIAQHIWREGHKRSVPLFAHLLTADGWTLLRTDKVTQ